MDLPTAARPRPPGQILRTAAAGLLLLGVAAMPALAATTPEIGSSPKGGHPPVPGVADYSTLFQDSNPAWLAIVGKFQVFNSSLDHLRNASDAEVLQTATNLHSHHVAWAITIAGVGREPGDTCAADEGYETPLSIQASMTRLLRLKIRPDIIVMDSPFWHGHLAPQDCRFPIPVLIQRIAANLSMVTAVFPGLTYGEIETWVQIQDNPGWQQDYAQMRDGIEVATGIRLSFVHTDTFIYAHPNWPASLVAAQAFVHQQGMKYGMIYDNMDQTTKTTSDVQWIADAKAGIGVMESQVHAIPDTAVIASWNPYPTHALPATDPTTLSSLLLYYLSLPHTP